MGVGDHLQAGDAVRPCPSFPGYEVSADGVVVSKRRRVAPLVLNTTTTTKGYRTVSVASSSGLRPVGVHQLVADAFLGPKPFAGAQVRHLDGDPANNCASNLAWGDAIENAADRQRHGRYARGARHPNARLTEEQVRTVLERRATGAKVRALALDFGVSLSTIEGILYGKAWKHVEFRRVTP